MTRKDGRVLEGDTEGSTGCPQGEMDEPLPAELIPISSSTPLVKRFRKSPEWMKDFVIQK